MSGTIPFPNGGGKGVPPVRGTKMDQLIDELYVVLPAKSIEEIQQKLKPLGQDVSIETIQQALFHLRKYCHQYGWTVPHVKRGPSSDERCYFAVLRDKDRGFTLPEQYRAYSKEGFNGTVSHIANLGKNEAVALRMLLQYEKSKVRRDIEEELLETIEFIAKRAKSLMKRLMNG